MIEEKSEIKLEKIIDEKLIKINIESTNKEEVIKELTNLLYNNNCISDKSSFINDVFEREKEGSTSLGSEVAIPHGKSDSVIRTCVSVGLLKNEIKWEDGENVKLIILFAVKNTDINTTHILLLQKFAIMLADDTLIEKLKNVKTEKELYKLIVEN